MATLLPEGKQSFTNNAGVPLVGGRVYTYDAGTNNPRTTYQDAAATVPNTNPIILDARGEATIFWTGSYKVELRDALNVLIWTVDQITDPATAANAYTDLLRQDITTNNNPAKGAGFIPFDPSLNYVARTLGAAVKDGYVNMMWFITSEVERAAIKAYTSTTDRTALINAALALGKRVYLPAGLWNADPDIGIILPAGGSLVGDGLMRTIIKAAAKGGTTGELASYTKGSVIKRAFTPGVVNAYVTGCYLADFSVQLNHPAYAPGNYSQIGIDMRNITRSTVERVHSGTFGIPGQPVCPTPSNIDACQGYGIAFGNRSSGSIDYCGGEVNVARDCLFWGAYRAITIDDEVISLLSSAHATLIDNCDMQGAHELCVQKQSYAAGVVMRNLTIQNNIRQSGNVNPTIGTQMGGYNGEVLVKYGEMGSSCDIVHNFISGSHNNKYESLYSAYTAPSAGAITDSGGGNSRNYMKYPAFAAGQPTGGIVEYYNKALLSGVYKGFWNGASFTVTYSNGITLTRTGVGDYFLNIDTAQPNANWIPQIMIDTNASGHMAGVTLVASTQSVTRIRFFCYAQNGGVSTVIDPQMVYCSFKQAI